MDNVVPDSTAETYRGHDGLMRAWGRWSEPWDQITTEIEEVIDGGDRIVSVHRARARAKGSGIEVDLRCAYLWRFREVKVIHFQNFLDREQALEAAGLSE